MNGSALTRGQMPIYLSIGASLGVILAYLIAGGASYQPLEAADPCEPRPISVLSERGVFEGIALSALDGAACDLQVTREELLAAFADEQALADFAEANGISEQEIDSAVRAGLIRAVDDAELEGLISPAIAGIARGIAENAPVAAVIDLFQALPGDVSIIDLLDAVQDLGLDAADLPDLSLESLEGLRDELEQLLPDDPSGLIPEELRDLLPEGLEGLEGLRESLEGVGNGNSPGLGEDLDSLRELFEGSPGG